MDIYFSKLFRGISFYNIWYVLENLFSNKQSEFSCKPIVLFFWSACFFIHIWQIYSIQEHPRKNENKLALSFNFTFQYIDDVLSLNISKVKLLCWMHPSHQTRNTICHRYTSAFSYIEWRLKIHNKNQLRTSIYDQIDDYSFPVLNFLFLFCNILTGTA